MALAFWAWQPVSRQWQHCRYPHDWSSLGPLVAPQVLPAHQLRSHSAADSLHFAQSFHHRDDDGVRRDFVDYAFVSVRY